MDSNHTVVPASQEDPFFMLSTNELKGKKVKKKKENNTVTQVVKSCFIRLCVSIDYKVQDTVDNELM